VRASRILIAALVIHAVAFAISAARSPEPAGDFDRYYAIGSSGGRPYVDYQVEHPIATLIVFKSLARLPRGRASFGLGVVLLDLAGDAVIVSSLLWGWGVVAAAFFAVTVIPVIGLFFNRIDAWSTAAAILAVAAWRRHRPLPLGAALAIGGAFKLWPLVLAPLLVVPWRGRRSVAARAAFAVTAAALAGTGLWMAGANSVLQVLTFRGASGWQIESLTGRKADRGGSAPAAVRWRSRCSSLPPRSACGAAGAARVSTTSARAGWRACRRCCCCRRCCRRSS